MIDNRSEDVPSRIFDITGSGVDYVVETTGNWKMYGLAIEVLNPHGTVALLTGASGTDCLPEGQRTLGIIQGDAIPKRIPKLIELYRPGQFPSDRPVRSLNPLRSARPSPMPGGEMRSSPFCERISEV